MLVREAASALVDDRRTQTVRLGHLDQACEALAMMLRDPPRTAADWVVRVGQLAGQADALVDIARTLTAERGDGEDSDVLVWAQATRATIASHGRDLERLMPWASHLEAVVADLPQASRGGRDREQGSLFFVVPHWPRWPTSARVRSASSRPCSTAARAPGPPVGIGSRKSTSSSGSWKAPPWRLERSSSDSPLSPASRSSSSMRWSLASSSTPARKIFSIGYRVTEGSLDPSAYDLLASEARLASFIAIANGGAPTSHWFHLGRPMTPVGLGAALVSWSGSMFEYLMPALVMQAPPGSLLQRTYRLVVQRQIGYGTEHGIPWGISESAYNVRDLDLTYQYSNFGVPGLGLERGLSEDLVVAPYATALAAMVDPGAAARNFTRLIAVGGGDSTASTRRWTTRRPGSRRGRPWRSFAPTWRTIRA